MEFRQVAYFKSVAESGSFARASQKLHIAQPALSNQISKLEGRLGTKLFVRHARGVYLTASGEVFLNHALKILSAIDDARIAIKCPLGEPSGVFTVGMPTTIAKVMAQPLLEHMKRSCPQLELQLVEALSGEIDKWHAAGRFDLAVLYHAPGECHPDAIPLFKEDLYLLRPAVDPGEMPKTIDFAALEGLPIYHTSRNHACRRLLDAASLRTGTSLSYVAEVDSIQLLYDLVRRKKGYSIFPSMPISGADAGVAYQRIINPDLHLASYVAMPPRCQTSKERAVLRELLPMLARQMHAELPIAPADSKAA